MYSFQNDYSEGAHPNILRALETINYHQNHSYGLDAHSDAARDLIQEALEDYSTDIHFIAGGTLTNLTFISHILRPYEAVISAEPVTSIPMRQAPSRQQDIRFIPFSQKTES